MLNLVWSVLQWMELLGSSTKKILSDVCV